MITIINKYTGEEICKYSNALVSEATEDSFIAMSKVLAFSEADGTQL